ncbi:hypothetical protein NECAME_08606 [Necator americanus]|uniref:Uncharacterized protein n=1 Tax=Necator americanus TaxID=51031 RepID=W2THM5_NECAM|nr:hypothetical protein NECAME_08606 [Necator americanus]ETN81298.1 hypothetical protein NECAME_08606 [Necator americanus]
MRDKKLPKFLSKEKQMELAPPPGQNCFEMVSTWLSTQKGFEEYPVTNSMDSIPKHRQSHVADLVEFANCTKHYHEKMAKILDAGNK